MSVLYIEVPINSRLETGGEGTFKGDASYTTHVVKKIIKKTTTIIIYASKKRRE